MDQTYEMGIQRKNESIDIIWIDLIHHIKSLNPNMEVIIRYDEKTQ